MSRRAILVVSFGTSYADTREKTIDAIENQIAETFPDWEVRRAFTSRMIIKKLRERDGIIIDYVDEAMDKICSEGFEEVVVQPTHIMNGDEYDDVVRIVSGYHGRISKLSIGRPLLTTIEDYDDAITAIDGCLMPLAGDGALILMGHGTEHYANSAYCQLQMKLEDSGMDGVFITTVEGYPDFYDTIRRVKKAGCTKVTAMPFMIVAGDHANNDMAGDEEDSLKVILEQEGFDVTCVVRGLGEFKGFRNLFVKHLEEAMGGL